jgi:cbb3-type cytochrome oxidase cytochrome c subunit
MMFSWRVLRWVVLVIVVVFVAMQVVPLDRSNPPVSAEVAAPPEARAVLRRACYDCHSNETVWPWYAWVAPVSWLVARDVHEGRRELNFSVWGRYTTKEQVKKLKETWETVEEGEMPPWYYLPLHRNARLSAQDKAVLQRWALSTPQKD